jgi:hypothetical protein
VPDGQIGQALSRRVGAKAELLRMRITAHDKQNNQSGTQRPDSHGEIINSTASDLKQPPLIVGARM